MVLNRLLGNSVSDPDSYGCLFTLILYGNRLEKQTCNRD